VWTCELGIFAVDFSRQGDEFAHHVCTEFGQSSMSGRGTDGACPVILGPPLDPSITSVLEIHPHADGIRCVVVGAEDDQEGSPGQVEPWSRVVPSAVAALGRRDQRYVWQAVVGTAAHEFGLDRLGALAKPTKLGPLFLEPGGVCMRERAGDRDRLDQGLGMRHSFPVVVTGGAVTYSWEHLRPFAERQLHRACTLLTLATGERWVPRTFPREQRAPEATVTIPATSPHDPQAGHLPMENEPWDGRIPEGAARFALPEWTATAWKALTDDAGLDEAVGAHYEATDLYYGHSSLSYLMFVAAIEGYGKRFVPDATCSCHPQCTHQKGVAEARFRRGLRTVVSGNQASKVSKYAYKARSTTGHQGSLLGSERYYGYEPSSLFGVAGSTVFDVSMLREIRDLSRAVLVNALKDAFAAKPPE
jgi:hypothetical protein